MRVVQGHSVMDASVQIYQTVSIVNVSKVISRGLPNLSLHPKHTSEPSLLYHPMYFLGSLTAHDLRHNMPPPHSNVYSVNSTTIIRHSGV